MRYVLIMFVATQISCSLAWSWTTYQTPPDSGLRVAEDIIQNTFDAELSQTAIDALFTSKDALESYQRKPDCFQDTIAMVKAHCEESRMDEQERIHAAIGMTMCELATARHYLPPMECVPFAGINHHPPPSTAQKQARCVDALSRSAQFWSSYSGYLREIPQLCFTFRRWIDIDTAKDIYRNITQEKATLVRFLTEREKGSKTTQQLWERTAEDIRDTLEALRLISNGMKDTSDMLTMTVINNSQSLLTEVQDAIQKIEDRDRINHGEIVTKFYSMLENVERDYSDHLLGLLPVIKSSITFELSTALALIKDESLRNIDMTMHLERRLGLLEGGLAAMQNSLEQLMRVIEDSSRTLETSLEQAKNAQVMHGDTMASMDDLLETVHLLTQTTHAEIVSINQTSSALKESLSRTPGLEWPNALLISLLQLFPEISLVNTAINSHTLRLIFGIINTLWHAGHFLASLFVVTEAAIERWCPPFYSPDDREACAPTWDTALEKDMEPPVKRPMRPRIHVPKRSFRSRIPDRLCRPSEEARWH